MKNLFKKFLLLGIFATTSFTAFGGAGGVSNLPIGIGGNGNRIMVNDAFRRDVLIGNAFDSNEIVNVITNDNRVIPGRDIYSIENGTLETLDYKKIDLNRIESLLKNNERMIHFGNPNSFGY